MQSTPVPRDLPRVKEEPVEIPLVSIITITFNSERRLAQTIQSVLGQDYPNIEYIIVDGGSSDGTLDIIKGYGNRIAKWVSEPDRGIANAMNKGIKMASGDIIGIIHSDDFFEPGAVKAVIRAFEEYPEADLVHGDLRLWNPVENSYIIQKPLKNPQRAIWRLMPFMHPTIFVRRMTYERYGLFDLSYRIAMDHELMLRFMLNGACFHYINRVLANMRTTGISQIHYVEAFKEDRNIVIRYGHSKIKAYSYYVYGILFRRVEKMAGLLLRRIGLKRFADLYRRVFYPHVPNDF